MMIVCLISVVCSCKAEVERHVEAVRRDVTAHQQLLQETDNVRGGGGGERRREEEEDADDGCSWEKEQRGGPTHT